MVARQRSIMMCVELRIRCTQPPSPAFFGSPPRLTEDPGRSAELRHQLAVGLFHLTRERKFQLKNGVSLPVYLYRPFSGVTLADELMAERPSFHQPTCPFLGT